MVNAALEAGADIREVVFHSSSPQGVRCCSYFRVYLAIHTWPEYGYTAVDVFTCTLWILVMLQLSKRPNTCRKLTATEIAWYTQLENNVVQNSAV